jgi:hypothetical protein
MTIPLAYKGPAGTNPLTVSTKSDDRVVVGSGNGTVRTIRPLRPYGLDTAHSSAPSVCWSKKYNKIFMLYRQGTDHFVSRDGVFKLSSSSDIGKTWTAPTTVLTMTPTWDAQGQGISESQDGTKLFMSYFKASAANGAAGVFFKTSTDGGSNWSAETRIDNSLPYAATTDVINELDDGTLVMVYYGRSGAETFDSIWIAKSTNGGGAWTNTRLANGQTASLHFNEPVLARIGVNYLIAGRYGGAQSVGTMLSTNSTTSWGTWTERFPGTGKPHIFALNSTTFVCIYRHISGGHAVMRTSKNNGTTWSGTRMVDPTMWLNGWMLYASSFKLADGVEFVALAQERGDAGATPGTSRIYFTCATEAGGSTPLGRVPDDFNHILVRGETTMYATTFDQPEGTAVDLWAGYQANGTATGVNVQDNCLIPATLNVFTGAKVFVRNLLDVDVEADIYTQSGSGSAAGIIVRGTSTQGTFLVVVAEDANFRLYKYVSGAATLLLGVANTHVYNRWNRQRVTVQGNLVKAWYNEVLLLTHTLASGDETTFGSGNYYGVKLFPQSGSTFNHRCRRFILREF